MAQITASMVNELRAKTGQGMMECKKALVESDGDMNKALDYFRKKGVKASLTERAATEGRVVGVAAEDGKSAALVEVNCNTDFTAKSDPVLALAAKAARLLLHNPEAKVVEASEVNADLTEASQKTGENVRIGRTAVLHAPSGHVGMYLYNVTGKIGVLVAVTGNATEDVMRDLGVHITAKTPQALSLNREGLPAELVAREKALAVSQAMESGKPQAIAEKIAEGKMRTFYEERVLLDQEFINPDKFKGSVGAYLKQNNCTLDKYVRIEVGQA